MLEILYRDDHFVAVNKPHGLLTHPSAIAPDAGRTAMQALRDQIGCWVYPAHRLDRKTGGVLLFALDQETHKMAQRQFAGGAVKKKYLAIVRGYADDQGVIDYGIKNDNGKAQEAVTLYRTLDRRELNIPFGKHPTSRYSLVEAEPLTGRMHQIRKHFSHILHPIIGDRPHGCNKQNRLFLERWQMNTMMLHAIRLEFQLSSGDAVVVEAPLHEEFLRMMRVMRWRQS